METCHSKKTTQKLIWAKWNHPYRWLNRRRRLMLVGLVQPWSRGSFCGRGKASLLELLSFDEPKVNFPSYLKFVPFTLLVYNFRRHKNNKKEKKKPQLLQSISRKLLKKFALKQTPFWNLVGLVEGLRGNPVLSNLMWVSSWGCTALKKIKNKF